MRVLAIQHDPIVKTGVVEEWTRIKNIPLNVIRIDLDEPLPSHDTYDLLVILGGRMGAYEEEKYPWLVEEKDFIRQALHRDKFILGLCLGSQLIASALGGTAYKHNVSEIGWHPVHFSNTRHPLLVDLPKFGIFFEFHNDTFTIPENASLIAESSCSKQGFIIGERLLALQFHPEFNEDIIGYIIENIYPTEISGPFIQEKSTVMSGGCFDESRKWMFQLMNNFHESYQTTIKNQVS